MEKRNSSGIHSYSAGIDLREIPGGGSPSGGAFYLYDLGELRRRTAYLRSRLPEGVSLCYAVKACPFLVHALASQVERVELCSPGEAEICDRLGVPKEKTVISGVYKTPDVIERMVANDAEEADKRPPRIYTVESLSQYKWLRTLAEKYPGARPLPLLLRLTGGSQFGIGGEEIEAILRENDPGVRVQGIQYFTGTQKTSLKKLGRELRLLDGFFLRLRETFGHAPEELEYGPGFPVSYFSDGEFDEETYLAEFSALLQGMESKPKLTLELGRSLAASCGYYATHIVDKKTNAGQNYLITDGGMHQLVYYGGQMAMRTPPVSVVGKEDLPVTASWNVCGALCSMNDILAKDLPLPPVEIGDLLCFRLAGAYAVTEGIALFLTRDLPAVYLLTEDGRLVLARKTTETVELNLPKLP